MPIETFKISFESTQKHRISYILLPKLPEKRRKIGDTKSDTNFCSFDPSFSITLWSKLLGDNICFSLS